MKEWGGTPDTETRRCLRESLRSPSLEVIEDLLKYQADITSVDYLRALQVAFGSTESDQDVAIRLYAMAQEATLKIVGWYQCQHCHHVPGNATQECVFAAKNNHLTVSPANLTLVTYHASLNMLTLYQFA